jgi:hypothetical protein
LDEHSTGVFIAAKFDSDIYYKVFQMMFANLEAVLADPNHGPRLKATITRWARLGW